MLTGYGRREWLTILLVGAAAAAAFIYFRWYVSAAIVVLVTLALLSFFRDPRRQVPSHKGVMVSPADGKVSSIHQVEHFEPLGEAATCIRIFLSVMDVHVNRAPCHGMVEKITPRPGLYLNALNPKSAEVNECNLILLVHPIKRTPLAAVRQVSGLIARTIVCAVRPGQTVQRGERIGMIKFGSTTELYIPASLRPEVVVSQGQRVYGGSTVVAKVSQLAGVESGEPAQVEMAPGV